MSIEKKSLISTLKTTKKANVAASDVNAKPATVATKIKVMRAGRARAYRAYRAS